MSEKLQLRFTECQVLCLVECRLKQENMAIVMWRTLRQRMSLTRGVYCKAIVT